MVYYSVLYLLCKILRKECMLSCFSHIQPFATLWTIQPIRLLCPWQECWQDSQGKNTGMGCHALLQGNLPSPAFKPTCLTSPALVGGLFTASVIWAARPPKHGGKKQRLICMQKMEGTQKAKPSSINWGKIL